MSERMRSKARFTWMEMMDAGDEADEACECMIKAIARLSDLMEVDAVL